eukprot:496597-Prymnesium_polylepis.1
MRDAGAWIGRVGAGPASLLAALSTAQFGTLLFPKSRFFCRWKQTRRDIGRPGVLPPIKVALSMCE